MTMSDDLNRLAAQDIVYLTRAIAAPVDIGGSIALSPGSTEVFRGRLRQALNGDWVFNASTGQNGVVGFLLGGVGNWSSSESPATGLQITMTFLVLQPVGPVLNEVYRSDNGDSFRVHGVVIRPPR